MAAQGGGGRLPRSLGNGAAAPPAGGGGSVRAGRAAPPPSERARHSRAPRDEARGQMAPRLFRNRDLSE